MKAFLDSDVLLDYLTARKPFLEEIKLIIHKGITQELELFTSSLILANIHYFISKLENKKQARIKVGKISSFIGILNVGEKEILQSISSNFTDFEDAIQNFCAIHSEMDLIITRNTKDFKYSELPILTPKEFLVKINTSL